MRVDGWGQGAAGKGLEAGRLPSLVPARRVLRRLPGAAGWTRREECPACGERGTGDSELLLGTTQAQWGKEVESTLARGSGASRGEKLPQSSTPTLLLASRLPGCTRNKFVVWKDSRPVIHHPQSSSLITHSAASPFPREFWRRSRGLPKVACQVLP